MRAYVALLTLAVAACANGVGEVDENFSAVAIVPGASPALLAAFGGDEVTVDAPLVLDEKSELSSLGDLGALSLSVSKNSLSGPDLSGVRHVKATIGSKDGKIPQQLAAEADVPAGSTEVELPLLIDDHQLLDCLTEGPAVIHLLLTGAISEKPLTLTYTLAARVNVAVKGSVLKF